MVSVLELNAELGLAVVSQEDIPDRTVQYVIESKVIGETPLGQISEDSIFVAGCGCTYGGSPIGRLKCWKVVIERGLYHSHDGNLQGRIVF